MNDQTPLKNATGLDPITMELVKGAIRSTRAEMEAIIERTAMSPFIREKKDYFTAFFDRQARLVVSTALPLASVNLVACVLEQYPYEEMKPGDVYLYNDAYGSRGAVSHLNDMVFVAPVFSDGRIVAFAEAWGHLWDIGGMTPGSISPAASDVFQEGVVLPPLRILRDGAWNEDILRIFLRNTRFPEMVRGDILALMASVRLGCRRMTSIVERFGAEIIEATFDAMIAQSERALRARLSDKIGDGRYSFRDWIDGDGVSKRSYSVAVSLEKQDDRITLDLTESDDQATGSINFIMDESVPKNMAGLFFCAQDPSVVPNSGFDLALDEVRTRPGSIVSPSPPAPLGMRSNTLTRVNSALFGALAKATDGQVPAASPVYVLYYLRCFDRARRTLALCIEGLAVGFGARPHADGIDSVYYVAQKNYPIEFAETEFGVRVERYSIHRDSGGPGRYRGGVGIVRDIRILADEALIGVRIDNCRYPAWGVNGGMSGSGGRVIVNPGRPDERDLLPMSENNALNEGDVVRIMTPGGGGWGSPIDRPSTQVRDDVLDGFVSNDSAIEHYGVVLEPDGLELDADATDRLRAELRKRPTSRFHRRGYFDEQEEEGGANHALPEFGTHS